MIETLPDLSALAPADLAILEEWVRAEFRKLREDPLNHGLPPHAVQEEVHCSDSQHVLLIAANRLGKSFCAMREVLWRATGTHPYKKLRPHEIIWVGFPDYPFYEKVTRWHFDRLVPRKYLIEFHETKKYAVFRRADGGTCYVYFLSYDMGREKWQGAGVDFIALDEEHPEEIYKEAYARLIDRDGEMLQTLTPVSGLGWIYDRLYLPGTKKQREIDVIEGALAEYDESRELCVGRPRVPHLSRRAILRFAREIPDEDERAIRIFGQFRARAGTIYKQFRAEVNVVPAFTIPPHWTVWAGIDPGFHGFAVVILAQAPDGSVYIVDEFYSQGENTDDRYAALSKKIRAIRGIPEEAGDAEVEPIVCYVDTEDPQTVMELNLRRAETNTPIVFASLEQGMKAVKAGILRTQQMLAASKHKATPVPVRRTRPAEGEPDLYFFDTLRSSWRIGEDAYQESRVLWEITRYLWKKPKKGSSLEQDEPDKESAHGAHMLDALRYGIMSRMGPPEFLKQDKYKEAGWSAYVWEDLDEMEEKLLRQIRAAA